MVKFEFRYARHNHGFDAAVSFVNQGFAYNIEVSEGAEEEKDYFYGVMAIPVANIPYGNNRTWLRCQNIPQGSFLTLAQYLARNPGEW